MKLKKHKYENADGAFVIAIVTTDNPDMLRQSAEKLKIKFPKTYPFLKYAGSEDYTDTTRGQW